MPIQEQIPQQMPPSQKDVGPADQGGGAEQLLTSINDNLNKLGDMIERSKLPQEDKQSFGNLMNAFYSFAENMSGSQDQQKPQQQQTSGNLPMEAGARNVQPMM